MDLNVFITGATGGLGEAMCFAFAKKGYRVAISYNKNKQKAENILKELPGEGHITVQCNINDTSSIRSAVSILKDKFSFLNVLINNAGMTKFVVHEDLDKLEDSLIDDIFQTHVRGSFACIREFHKILSDKSSIINITSIAGESGNGSNIAYCAAKAALDTMTKSLARVLAPKTRVMAVAPGLVDTDFIKGLDKSWRDKQESITPLKRLADPREVADAVIACVETLSFSTGRTIYVDGGRHLA